MEAALQAGNEAGGALDAVAVVAQQRDQGRPLVRMVVDDQDAAGGHGPALSGVVDGVCYNMANRQ